MTLSEPQIRRYARHILLHDVGGIGQRRLLDARVAIDDAGRASGAALLYLAAAGIGTLVVGDRAVVSRADVGLVFLPEDVGRPRAEALAERLGALNPDVAVVTDGDASWRLREILGADPVDALADGSAAAGELVRRIARGTQA